MPEYTLRQMVRALADFLAGNDIDASEAKAMANLIVENVKGYSALDIAIHGDRTLLPETAERMFKIAKRVKEGEPLQYVLGEAYFRGRYFWVSPATLIPRPETAALVDMVTDVLKRQHDSRILDIGTGSGCIAISLALDLPYAQVDAIDISDDALEVARKNASALKASINLIKADALRLSDSVLARKKYDAIVSNPPYIMQSEKSQMDSRVKDFEPSEALFVPDNSPLIFYEAIARFALTALQPKGWLFFEINPLCAATLTDMLLSVGFECDGAERDYKGNLRFIKAQLSQ